MRRVFLLCTLWLSALPAAYADQGSITNTGTSATPAGTLTIAGNSLTYFSTDELTAINATFTTSSSKESCSGGGRGGHITCYTTLTGSFSGTLSVNDALQAINGSTYQSGVVGRVQSGTTVYNSAYTPFYFSDSEQIHRSDDIYGTNMVSCCSQGFYGAYGIALDPSGRIYVADTYNARVVRIDDMNGTNWTSFGTYGSDVGQFNDPQGIAVDSLGRIYVMDTNNARLVRMDDMNGTNWTVFNAVGSGPGQLSTFTSVAVDARNRIYVADTGNRQIVRMDDITGAGWTVLNQSEPVNGATYTFSDPVAVAVGADFKIYVADNEYAPAVVRVEDMSGANWVSVYVSPSGSGGLNSIAVDATGMVLTGGGGVRLVDNMAGFLSSTNAVCPVGCYYVFGVTAVPLPSPRPSAISFTPPALSFSTNLGTSSAQSITITNFGGSPLNLGTIATSDGFAETNNCPSQLAAGSTCTVSITFTPPGTGPVNALLTIHDDSGNLGATQTVALVGTGTTPPTATPSATATPAVCIGDCDGNDQVTIDEILALVNIALGSNPCPGDCRAGAECPVAIDQILAAVNNSLAGCLSQSDGSVGNGGSDVSPTGASGGLSSTTSSPW